MLKSEENIVQIKPFGDRAIELSWPQKIELKTLYNIHSVSKKINEHYHDAPVQLVPAYASLLVRFNYPIDLKAELDCLRNIVVSNTGDFKKIRHRWHIPVCYDDSFAWDVEVICKRHGIDKTTLIDLHTGTDYPIYFFGFLPGFFYLGDLDKRLHCPRKETPRLQVPKGSVGIGGMQTGVYPQDSPGGWQIIGRTPITLFDVNKTIPVFAEVGDVIRFYPIHLEEYKAIEIDIASYSIRKEVLF